MRTFFRSIVTACLIAAAVQCFTLGVLGSNLPRVVGRPDIREERQFQFAKVKHVRLNNEDGLVQVRTHDLDEIWLNASISAYVRSRSDVPAVQSYVASLIRANGDAGVLDIATEPHDRPDSIDLRVDYSLLVPEGTDITVDGANGNVWISKGCGRVSVQGRNADIEIVQPRGPVLARSTNGRIRVLDASGDATLRTVNGNVYAYMRGGALDASTTNGSIVAYVLGDAVSACSLNTQNGGITLVMRDDCSATVEAATERGAITSDFPVSTADGTLKRRHLHGTIREGHTKVKMDTLNGNVWIAKGAA